MERCEKKCSYRKLDNKKEKTIFTKDTIIAEVLDYNPKLCVVLEGFGMHCLGCPMCQMETLEEASDAHEIDLNLMLEKLNNFKT